ncbi:epsilon-trimethyllysine 2-oxoglutarate dioxygenase [Anopheles darlingi]|uniref:Trimethyllysine dioxygenase, mitochondrial n=1 Tax=Anopheles darlingi TaxID=43151 RepID=W5JCZ6_ANODA|nr:epsilon-trimethyllysine 2-oxoglutarate dioxygenase [Anopheles darlingi]
MQKLRACCVPCCNREKQELVHKFPADNERAEQWVKILNVADFEGLPIDNIRKRFFVCTRHFRDSDYKNKASRCINITAVPSLNLKELTDAEGLQRIPPVVRPEIVHQLPHRTSYPTAVAASTIRTSLVTSQLVKIKSVTTANALSKKAIRSGLDKEDDTNAHHERLDEFMDDPFPTKSPLPASAAAPSTTGVWRSTRRQSPTDTPAAKMPKLISQPQTKPKEPIVLQRVKMMPPMAVRKSAAISKMTQTEMEDDQHQAADKQNDKNEGDQSATISTTKVLALLECTPENLQKLRRKLEEQGGILDLNERLWQTLDDETEDDKAMGAAKDTDSTQFLTIKSAATDETVRVSYVWLRDHCRCRECYNEATYQRSYSILDLPLDIQPLTTHINDQEIIITWNDGHQSSYNVEEILENRIEAYQKCQEERRAQMILWDRDVITAKPVGYASVTLNDLLCEDEMMNRIVASLVTYGFAFITKVPPNQQSTEMAVKRLFPIQKTLFGEMWTFSESKMDHSDTAYTNGYLGPHNDNTYFSDAAGLQVLHCIQFNGEGAETMLVDGFRAAERMREADVHAFERLCSYPLEAEYIEEDKHHRHVAPVIRCNSITQTVEQIRFNPADRAALKSIPSESVPQFYADYQRFAREVYSKELEWKFQLTPGTVLIFDNWRLLHGRMAYRGKRVMTGCYVARTEYQSVARKMGLIE